MLLIRSSPSLCLLNSSAVISLLCSYHLSYILFYLNPIVTLHPLLFIRYSSSYFLRTTIIHRTMYYYHPQDHSHSFTHYFIPVTSLFLQFFITSLLLLHYFILYLLLPSFILYHLFFSILTSCIIYFPSSHFYFPSYHSFPSSQSHYSLRPDYAITSPVRSDNAPIIAPIIPYYQCQDQYSPVAQYYIDYLCYNIPALYIIILVQYYLTSVDNSMIHPYHHRID